MNMDLFVPALEAIYAAAPEPSLWPDALQAITDVFGDVGTVLLWHRDDGSVGAITSPALVDCLNEYVRQGWNKRDTLAIKAIERGVWFRHDTASSEGFITVDEWRSDPFCSGFRASHGLGHVLATGVSPDPHVAVAVSVQRALCGATFTMDESLMLSRLGRHVEKSLRLSIRLFDAELSRVGLAEALSRLRIGVFALDSDKRVVFANRAAKKALGDGLALSGDRLLISDTPGRLVFEEALEGAIGSDLAHDPSPILIRRPKSERPLSIYILPVLSHRSPASDFLTRTRAILLIMDSGGNDSTDPAIVRDLLGLTLGEARVAALVGAGIAPREAAAKLGITEETARTTLKRVFAKAGVSRQSELAALLTKLVLQ